MNEITNAMNLISKAQTKLGDAKNTAYDAIVNCVRVLCKEYNVDHINLENVNFKPSFYDDTEDNTWSVASIRIDPESEDCLQITRFYEEEWDKAMNCDGYIWIDFYDVFPDYDGIMLALSEFNERKQMAL